MNARILLVTADRDANEDLKCMLETAWEEAEEGGSLEPPLFDHASTVSECHRRLESNGGEYMLVVTTLQVPPEGRSSRDDMEERGFEVAQACADRDEINASVLIVTAYGASTSDLGRLQLRASEFDGCRLVPTERQYMEEFLTNIIRQRKSEQQQRPAEERPEPETPQVTVDIDLHGETATYTLTSVVGRPNSGPLDITGRQLDRMRKLSDMVPRGNFPDWINMMRMVGEDMFDMLETRNSAFWRALSERSAGHPERARFRFTLTRDDYPILVEAMVPPVEVDQQDVRDFWMLKTPVVRRLSPPQFSGAYTETEAPLVAAPRAASEPLNCLIIEADAHTDEAFTVGTRRIAELRQLENVTKECDWLEGYLTKDLADESGAEGKPLIGRVERINRERVAQEYGPATRFADALADVLGGERWHLVHFAGHSYYDENFVDQANNRKGRGWLFLPGPDGQVEAFTAERFAAVGQQRPELVYLSSCHGSREDVAFELGRSLVPAIIGFRWDIPDREAIVHAHCFYKALFAPDGGLEAAFLRTRQEMFERNREDKAWAASMLVLEA